MRESPASSVGITVSNPNAGRTTNTRGNSRRTGTRRACVSAWRRSSARCSAASRASAGPTGAPSRSEARSASASGRNGGAALGDVVERFGEASRRARTRAARRPSAPPSRAAPTAPPCRPPGTACTRHRRPRRAGRGSREGRRPGRRPHGGRGAELSRRPIHARRHSSTTGRPPAGAAPATYAPARRVRDAAGCRRRSTRWRRARIASGVAASAPHASPSTSTSIMANRSRRFRRGEDATHPERGDRFEQQADHQADAAGARPDQHADRPGVDQRREHEVRQR